MQGADAKRVSKKAETEFEKDIHTIMNAMKSSTMERVKWVGKREAGIVTEVREGVTEEVLSKENWGKSWG